MLPFSFEAVIHGSSGSEKLNSFRLLSLSDALQNIMGVSWGSRSFWAGEKTREVDPGAYGRISSSKRFFAA